MHLSHEVFILGLNGFGSSFKGWDGMGAENLASEDHWAGYARVHVVSLDQRSQVGQQMEHARIEDARALLAVHGAHVAPDQTGVVVLGAGEHTAVRRSTCSAGSDRCSDPEGRGTHRG